MGTDEYKGTGLMEREYAPGVPHLQMTRPNHDCTSVVQDKRIQNPRVHVNEASAHGLCARNSRPEVTEEFCILDEEGYQRRSGRREERTYQRSVSPSRVWSAVLDAAALREWVPWTSSTASAAK